MAHQRLLPASRSHGYPGRARSVSGNSCVARMKYLHVSTRGLQRIAGCSDRAIFEAVLISDR
jgi:hypothetical protein